MSVPYQREKTHHKLVLQDFQEIMPPEDLRSFKLILGLVVMDINGELPHFSLLVVDNVRKQVKHFCSLQVKSWQFLKMHFYNHIQCCQRAVCKFWIFCHSDFMWNHIWQISSLEKKRLKNVVFQYGNPKILLAPFPPRACSTRRTYLSWTTYHKTFTRWYCCCWRTWRVKWFWPDNH